MPSPFDPVSDARVKARRDLTAAREKAMQEAIASIHPEHLHLSMAALGIPMNYPKGGPYSLDHLQGPSPGDDARRGPPPGPEADSSAWLEQMAQAGAPGLQGGSMTSEEDQQGWQESQGQMLKAEALDATIKRKAAENRLQMLVQAVGQMQQQQAAQQTPQFMGFSQPPQGQ